MRFWSVQSVFCISRINHVSSRIFNSLIIVDNRIMRGLHRTTSLTPPKKNTHTHTTPTHARHLKGTLTDARNLCFAQRKFCGRQTMSVAAHSGSHRQSLSALPIAAAAAGRYAAGTWMPRLWPWEWSLRDSRPVESDAC